MATTYDPFGVGRGDCDRGNWWDGSKALEPVISLPNYLAPINWDAGHAVSPSRKIEIWWSRDVSIRQAFRRDLRAPTS